MSTSLSAVVLAIALFGLLAGIVAPTVESSDTARLESAAQELATLFRLAQGEAMRSGDPHGVVFNPTDQSFKVSMVDPAVEPFTILSATYHPIRKQPLTWQPQWLNLNPGTDLFDYEIYGTSNYLMFDAWGTPLLPMGGTYRRLVDTSLALQLGNQSKSVKLLAHTGRVVVQ